MLDTIEVHKARAGFGEKFGARKYATIPSLTEPNKQYQVVKVRLRNRHDYKYQCTCADFMFRQHQCKHITQFKVLEGIC